MVKECWQEMTADEKADLLREAFKEAIDRKDAANAEIDARISALEAQAARVESMPYSFGNGCSLRMSRRARSLNRSFRT